MLLSFFHQARPLTVGADKDCHSRSNPSYIYIEIMMIMMIIATRVEHLDFLPLYLLKFSRLYVIYIGYWEKP